MLGGQQKKSTRMNKWTEMDTSLMYTVNSALCREVDREHKKKPEKQEERKMLSRKKKR